mmetsp:Transcript_13756/g.40696  ORF Transcript_13756/g.40696 Transcript_13756/m.40696 type:complete len:280 (+) Transcript_13756:788-1627(+)
MMTRLMPKALCSGASAMSAMAVVQLGLASSLAFLQSLPLISGTTSGTSLSMRNADELSITTGPPSAQILLAYSTLKSPPTARNMTSQERARSRSNSSRVTLPKRPQSCSLPALRAEPKSRRSSTASLLFSRHCTISTPTAPVAPATPTLIPPSAIMVMRRASDALRGTSAWATEAQRPSTASARIMLASRRGCQGAVPWERTRYRPWRCSGAAAASAAAPELRPCVRVRVRTAHASHALTPSHQIEAAPHPAPTPQAQHRCTSTPHAAHDARERAAAAA